MPWLTKRWISFFVASAVVGVVLVSVVGWANNVEGIKAQNKLDSYGTDPTNDTFPGTNWTAVDTVLVGLVQVNSFDPNGKTGPAFGVQLSYNSLLNQSQFANFIVPIQITVQQKPTNFSANSELPSQAFSLNAPGNPNNYPFDSYSAFIDIETSILPFNGNLTNNGLLPLTVFTLGALQGFTYTPQFQGNDDGSQLFITFTIQRSTTTRVFAVIVFLLMWCLSLSIFVAAMSVWFRGKNTELPLVAISTALFFALPNIRNSQPGVPSPVGTTEDMVGFFWNILLVAISAISLLIKWILQNKRPPRNPTDVEK